MRGMPYHCFPTAFWKRNKALVAVGLHRSPGCRRLCYLPPGDRSPTHTYPQKAQLYERLLQSDLSRTAKLQWGSGGWNERFCSSCKIFAALLCSPAPSAQVPWDQSLGWWLSTVLQPRVEGFQGGRGTINPIRLLLNSRGDRALQRQGETLSATCSLQPLFTSSLSPFSLPQSKLTGGEPRSLYKHVLQGIKDYWAVMSWMRILTMIPPLRVQTPSGACDCCPSAAPGKQELMWGGHQQNPGTSIADMDTHVRTCLFTTF